MKWRAIFFASFVFPSWIASISYAAPQRRAEIVFLATDPDEDWVYKEYRPLLDEITMRSGRSTSIFVARTMADAQAALDANVIDFTIDSFYSIALLNGKNQWDITHNVMREGNSAVSGCIFARKNAAVQNLQQLLGQKIAFESERSTSGFALPVSTMGLKFDGVFIDSVGKKNTSDDRSLEAQLRTKGAYPNGYLFVFAGKEDTVRKLVQDERVAAGGSKCKDVESRGNEFKILSKSPEIPRAIVAKRRNMDEAVWTDIKNVMEALKYTSPAMLNMSKTIAIKPLDKTQKDSLLSLTPGMVSLYKSLNK